MGYDCRVVDEDGRSVYDSTCDVEGHDVHYYRRNIWGGGRQADILVKEGLGYWPVTSERPPWPKVDGAEWGEYSDELEDRPPLNDEAREEQRLTIAYLKATYNEAPGISVYKLCDSNDGWWVTRAECQSALALWEQKGQPKVDEYGDTIPFLRSAAAHHGFRVY